MPKIYIKGENTPIIVSQEEADRILEQKNDLKYKGMINVGIREIAKGNIKEISYTDERNTGKYDLNNPADRQTVREFEVWLEELKGKYQPVNPIEFYGHPLKDQSKYPGIVLNELLGGVHWTLVRWALDNQVISRRDGQHVSWAIVSHGGGDRIDTAPYNELKRKMDGLTELKSRRRYAEGKELEEHAKIVEESREQFATQTTIQTDDDLPF